MSGLIQIEKISFFSKKESEGRFVEDLSVDSVSEADKYLRNLAKNLPTKGFEKISYQIRWRDGKWHRGYIPLRSIHQYSEMVFTPHVSAELMTAAGIRCPRHMTPDEYISYIRMKNEKYPNYSEHAKMFFCNYAR